MDINWVVIQPEITDEERKLLEKYKVEIYDSIDSTNDSSKRNAFENSMAVIEGAETVVSTDTSLVHISLNLNIPTCVLLTVGCEWRWSSNDEKTPWYPKALLFKQPKFGDWNSVVSCLKTHLQSQENI